MSPRLTPRPKRTLDEQRGDWRTMAAEAVKVANRAIETDGRELLDLIHYRHRLVTIGKTRFPAALNGYQAAEGLADAFVTLAHAFNNAGEERRRAIVAPALLAAAQAVDAWLTEDGHAAAHGWQRQFGESE